MALASPARARTEVMAMLDITGICCSGLDAVDYFESLADGIADADKDEYEAALNRLRYLVAKDLPTPVRDHKQGNHNTYHVCGRCGSLILTPTQKFCADCGARLAKANT